MVSAPPVNCKSWARPKTYFVYTVIGVVSDLLLPLDVPKPCLGNSAFGQHNHNCINNIQLLIAHRPFQNYGPRKKLVILPFVVSPPLELEEYPYCTMYASGEECGRRKSVDKTADNQLYGADITIQLIYLFIFIHLGSR
jgi:hypothetical protein